MSVIITLLSRPCHTVLTLKICKAPGSDATFMYGSDTPTKTAQVKQCNAHIDRHAAGFCIGAGIYLVMVRLEDQRPGKAAYHHQYTQITQPIQVYEKLPTILLYHF